MSVDDSRDMVDVRRGYQTDVFNKCDGKYKVRRSRSLLSLLAYYSIKPTLNVTYQQFNHKQHSAGELVGSPLVETAVE